MADLPPVTGLYVSLFSVVMYLILGTSNHLSIGRKTLFYFSNLNIIHVKLKFLIKKTQITVKLRVENKKFNF